MDKFKLNQLFLTEAIKDKYQRDIVEISISDTTKTFDYKPYLKILNKSVQQINKAILKELYSNYKRVWAEGKPLSPQKFIQSFNVKDITFQVYKSGEVIGGLWYKPNGIFTDHAIYVSGSFKNNKYIIDDVGF